jgi:hypothetical protein
MDAHVVGEHDQDVMQMNEPCFRASEPVQQVAARFNARSTRPGHPIGSLRDPLQEESDMFKTLSAALIAVSVLAAPAIAATSDKGAQAPATSTKQAQVKKSPLNANAKAIHHRHHVRHSSHHRLHKKATVGKAYKSPNVAAKPVTHPAKRG